MSKTFSFRGLILRYQFPIVAGMGHRQIVRRKLAATGASGNRKGQGITASAFARQRHRASTSHWWAMQDLNLRPLRCKRSALAN